MSWNKYVAAGSAGIYAGSYNDMMDEIGSEIIRLDGNNAGSDVLTFTAGVLTATSGAFVDFDGTVYTNVGSVIWNGNVIGSVIETREGVTTTNVFTFTAGNLTKVVRTIT